MEKEVEDAYCIDCGVGIVGRKSKLWTAYYRMTPKGICYNCEIRRKERNPQ